MITGFQAGVMSVTAKTQNNLLAQPYTFTDFQGITKTGTVTGVDGATAYKFTESSANETHRLRGSNIAVTSGVSYTASVVVKYISRQYFQVNMNSVSALRRVIFNIQNGTITDQNAGGSLPTSASILDLGDGWYKLSVTVVATITGNKEWSAAGGNSTSTGNNEFYTGSGLDAWYVSTAYFGLA